MATGDRCKVAHTYNRRSELPEELQDSEEARGVWRAAQQASEGVPHQEANGWLIKYRMRASATSKLGDLYLHPPPDERGVTSKVVRSMSALHDVLLLRHEARVMGAAWQPPRQGHYVELLVEMQGAVPPPPETWLQCDGCGKWRHLPSTMVAAEQPELRWECSLNPEARYSTCEAEQQYSDDEIDRRLAQAPPGEAWRRATVRRVALDLGGRFQVSLSLPSESGAGRAGGVGGLGGVGAVGAVGAVGGEEERKEWLWKDSEGRRWRRVPGQPDPPPQPRVARAAVSRLGDRCSRAALLCAEPPAEGAAATYVLLREVPAGGGVAGDEGAAAGGDGSAAGGGVLLEAVAGGTVAGDSPFQAETLLRFLDPVGVSHWFLNRQRGGGGGGGGGGGVRARRCGQCAGCLVTDHCGACPACRNMVRFGGPGTAKQCCVHRKCSAPLPPSVPGGGAAGGRQRHDSGEAETEATRPVDKWALVGLGLESKAAATRPSARGGRLPLGC